MISILTQERLLGVALGAAFTASVVLENRRAIHRSISDNRPEHMLEKKMPSEFAQMWNKAVDRTLGQLIIYLSSRGW
ncbi:hypothetical protein MUK42_03592 [Musa troglodytarum]|uniref:Uncharacterized protein n=1 Tax=Musa troglodytarum TaxID=320322 RepID=A0A9E7EJ23_9LILI|nr:hypothetical protein MUK42_03592 [Musa troglodytarum]